MASRYVVHDLKVRGIMEMALGDFGASPRNFVGLTQRAAGRCGVRAVKLAHLHSSKHCMSWHATILLGGFVQANNPLTG
jgi:hypothetical protein